jgi:hypothetical protein
MRGSGRLLGRCRTLETLAARLTMPAQSHQVTCVLVVRDLVYARSDREPPMCTLEEYRKRLCVPKIRFCNIGDEGHQAQVVM